MNAFSDSWSITKTMMASEKRWDCDSIRTHMDSVLFPHYHGNRKSSQKSPLTQVPTTFPDRPSSCLVKPRNTASMGSFLSPIKPLNALSATLPPATDPSHSFFWKWRRQRPREESGTKGNFLELWLPSPQLRESMGEQGKRPWEIFINFLFFFKKITSVIKDCFCT